MPQHKSAIKRLRQNKKRQMRNKTRRSTMRNLIKDVLQETDKKAAEEKLTKAFSYIDKNTSKGILHANTAARKKAQLNKHVNNL